jgi:hypothetical protein
VGRRFAHYVGTELSKQTVLSLTPLEFETRIPILAGDLLSLRRFVFLEPLATLIPPLRHRRSSHGVLAPHRFAGSKTGQRELVLKGRIPGTGSVGSRRD